MANPANLYAGGSSEDPGRTALKDREPDKVVEAPKKSDLLSRYWREVERYDRATKSWEEEGENIVKVYMNEGPDSAIRRFALLWANVETLKPAVYSRLPVVQCSRRYRDKDKTARVAAELMERATNTSLELYGVDEVFRMVRDDRLLPGRGTAWVRYEAAFDTVQVEQINIDPVTQGETIAIVEEDRLRSEQVCVDYVHWQDFGHNVARVWKDVWLSWRWVYKTKDEVADRFGTKVAEELVYNTKAPSAGESVGHTSETEDRCARICELWDKANNKVSWAVEGASNFLESGEPPIKLTNFFPCPEPLYATKTSKSLIPRADYCYYRDQAKEINDLTDKIHRLTQWLIVKAFVPGGPSSVADPIEEVLRDKGNRELFAQVDSMAEWSDRGGATKLIDWFPLAPVIQAIQAAIQARAQLIQDVFQITGIADVLRGQSDPNETATAVDIRSQTGTRRLRNTKDEISRFCRDVARLMAEVIAENFSPKTLAEMTGFKYIPPMEQMVSQMGLPPAMGHNGGPPLEEEPGLTFDDATLALLREDRLRSFRIDVETDSTVQADENAEKRSRTEFAEVAGTYLERAVRVVQAAPALAKTAKEILTFVTRAYRAGRGLEETIEQDFNTMVNQFAEKARQPAAKDPVIEVAEVQVAGEIEKNRTNSALKAQEIQTDAALEVRKQDLDAMVKVRDQNIDAQMKSAELGIEAAKAVPPRFPALRPVSGGLV